MAPFLGLAGTSYASLAGLFFGYSGSLAGFFYLIETRTASSLIMDATAIFAAITAIVADHFVRTLADRIQYDCLRVVPSAIAINQSQARAQPFRRAQTLPLRKRFSGLPSYGLVAAPVLASIVTLFLTIEPYESPTGLDVRLLPVGPVHGDRESKLLVIRLIARENGTLGVRLNSNEITATDLEQTLHNETKMLVEPQAYIEADRDLPWADVARVIDGVRSLPCEVVLLTTTPTRNLGCGWPRSNRDRHCVQ